jgi:hypothetical protein
VSAVVFILLAPKFPSRFIVVAAFVAALARLAAIPFNHYLDHYVCQYRQKANGLNSDATKPA